MKIRDLRPLDWPEVARIYEEGMLSGNATFETGVPSWEAWDAGHLADHRLVVTRDDEIRRLGRALTRLGPLLLQRRRRAQHLYGATLSCSNDDRR